MRALPVLAAIALAACQRPLPPQVLQPVPPPLGPVAPRVLASKLQPATVQALASVGTCNLEAAAGAPFDAAPVTIHRRAPAPLSGWAALDAMPPSRIELVAVAAADPRRAWQAEVPVSVERDDVAAYFKSSAMRRSGFAAHVDFSALPPGDYRLLMQFGEGAQRRACDNDRRVRLVD